MAKQEIEMHGLEEDDISETPVTKSKAVAGEPLKGTIAWDRKYGKYTAKGLLRKKPNPNTPPKNESEEIEVNEVSDWESRHDEFTKAGAEATPDHISKVQSQLKKLSSKAESKRGILNQIVGKRSNGDLSRAAFVADGYHKLLDKNKNAKHGTDDRKELGQHLTYAKSLIARHKDLVESEDLDEMDFGSIGKTLSKYGKGVPAGEPKKPTRSTVHTDYTMTGHQEKKSSTGRVYTKAPEMDREPEAIKATAKVDQVEAPKRGRGRPAGATNKAGTGKGWSAEAKASMKAKLAARKAAKLAANESEELDELSNNTLSSYRDKVGTGYNANVSPTKTAKRVAAKNLSGDDAKKEADRMKDNAKAGIHKAWGRSWARQTGETHKHSPDAYAKQYKESVELTEEDWADIVEDQSMDSIVEFMMEEEYQSLDELSKKTLGSYVKKATAVADNARKYAKIGDPDDADFATRQRAYASKKEAGIAKADKRLTKESVELEEVKKDSFGRPSHPIDRVKQKIRDGLWEPQTDLKVNAHVEIRHTKTGKRETIHVRESEDINEVDAKKQPVSYHAKQLMATGKYDPSVRGSGAAFKKDLIATGATDSATTANFAWNGHKHLHGAAKAEPAATDSPKGYKKITADEFKTHYNKMIDGSSAVRDHYGITHRQKGGKFVGAEHHSYDDETKTNSTQFYSHQSHGHKALLKRTKNGNVEHFIHESEELDEAKDHKPGYVAIAVNPGVSDLAKSGKKYTVYFKPNADSSRGRTKPVDISHHEDLDSAKAAKAAYVEKHKAHGVEALRGMGEATEVVESVEDINIQRYAALIGKNLIKE